MFENFSVHWPYVYVIAFAVMAGVAHTMLNRWRRLVVARKHFAQRQAALQAARLVHVTREYTERFFRQNPEETFSTYRGKEMLVHHRTKYEEYLQVIGMKAGPNGYRDSYWAQIKKLEREGGELRELPSLPPASSVKHRALGVSQ